jgi:hypothetical protein
VCGSREISPNMENKNKKGIFCHNMLIFSEIFWSKFEKKKSNEKKIHHI